MKIYISVLVLISLLVCLLITHVVWVTFVEAKVNVSASVKPNKCNKCLAICEAIK